MLSFPSRVKIIEFHSFLPSRAGVVHHSAPLSVRVLPLMERHLWRAIRLEFPLTEFYTLVYTVQAWELRIHGSGFQVARYRRYQVREGLHTRARR